MYVLLACKVWVRPDFILLRLTESSYPLQETISSSPGEKFRVKQIESKRREMNIFVNKGWIIYYGER